MSERSWFTVDGTLEPLAYPGDSDYRFPEAVADYALQRWSAPGDWVLDPLCGLGTTLVVAERLGRNAAGVELDAERAAFAASRLRDPSRVVHGDCEDVQPGRWPPFAMLLTSPPYGSFTDEGLIDSGHDYVESATRIFGHLATLLAPDALVVVEVAQVRTASGTRPVVWRIAEALQRVFTLQDDVVRINTGAAEAALGYDHSHLLVFRHGGERD